MGRRRPANNLLLMRRWHAPSAATSPPARSTLSTSTPTASFTTLLGLLCRRRPVERSQHKRCNEVAYSWLQFLWMVIYVTNLAAGYLTYDFARSYLDSGGFTVRRRLVLAWIDVRNW